MPVLSIDGVIGWDISGNFVRNFLTENENKDITVEISSPGGSVFEGINISNMLKNHKGKVTTHIMGMAASMASVIALVGDEVIVEKDSVFMIHNASAGVGGDHRDMRKMADLVEKLSNMLAKTYVSKTGKPMREIRQLMDDETFFVGGKEIMSAGFADRINENKSDEVVDLETILISAQARIESCFNTMKESDRAKNDINKAAALLTDFDLNNNQNTVSNEIDNVKNNVDSKKIDNVIDKKQNKTEAVKMTPEQIKADFPETYNTIFNTGVNSVMENIEAHSEWFDVAPEAALDAIKKNETFTPKHASKYAKAQLKHDDISNHQADNEALGNIVPQIQNTENADKIALEAFENALDGKAV
jgi:ATP-dependent Clp endopeptidase proteolytic subunit ClpP